MDKRVTMLYVYFIKPSGQDGSYRDRFNCPPETTGRKKRDKILGNSSSPDTVIKQQRIVIPESGNM